MNKIERTTKNECNYEQKVYCTTKLSTDATQKKNRYKNG